MITLYDDAIIEITSVKARVATSYSPASLVYVGKQPSNQFLRVKLILKLISKMVIMIHVILNVYMNERTSFFKF